VGSMNRFSSIAASFGTIGDMADDWFHREAREQRVLARVRERFVQDKAVRERTSLPHFGGLTPEREARYTRLVEAEDADRRRAVQSEL
jgi:hypothetical protein